MYVASKPNDYILLPFLKINKYSKCLHILLTYAILILFQYIFLVFENLKNFEVCPIIIYFINKQFNKVPFLT